jgi:hypothetical protein
MVRLSKIDDSNRDDHARLTDDDNCLYLFEYTSGKGYSFSATNNLISNLKKKPSTRLKPGYQYKQQAVTRCATALSSTLNPAWLDEATLVPVPGSKVQGHVDYDDRIERICRGVRQQIDVRALVQQTSSTEASHEAVAGSRVTVEELLSVYRINETLVTPAPISIGIIDDVLTAGTHFRAMDTILRKRFPDIPIVGIFIARRVFPNPFEDAD